LLSDLAVGANGNPRLSCLRLNFPWSSLSAIGPGIVTLEKHLNLRFVPSRAEGRGRRTLEAVLLLRVLLRISLLLATTALFNVPVARSWRLQNGNLTRSF
jgi:hypothetical protein